MINRLIASLAALMALAVPAAASASLPVGATAPAFVTQGAKAGKVFSFDLKKALRSGPVVLYFFPKAFTQGCTLETHAFADASDQFKQARATIIGLSADGLPILQKFSLEACRSKFGVATATPDIVRAYDVDLKREGASTGLTARTSYVIAPGGKVVMVHSDMDWREHVKLTLATVQGMRGK